MTRINNNHTSMHSVTDKVKANSDMKCIIPRTIQGKTSSESTMAVLRNLTQSAMLIPPTVKIANAVVGPQGTTNPNAQETNPM